MMLGTLFGIVLVGIIIFVLGIGVIGLLDIGGTIAKRSRRK